MPESVCLYENLRIFNLISGLYRSNLCIEANSKTWREPCSSKAARAAQSESKREIGSLVNPGVRSIGADDVEDLLHDQAVLAGVDGRVLSGKVRVVLYRHLGG